MVKSEQPQLCLVIELVKIWLEIITVFRICDDPKNCTVEADVRKSIVVVVSPLEALMLDVAEAFMDNGYK